MSLSRCLLALLAGSLLFAAVCSAAVPFWTEVAQKGAIPDPVFDGSATYADGLFWFFGGLNGTWPNDHLVSPFAVYDTESETWQDLSDLPNAPEARAEAMMWHDGSRIMLSGGRGPFRRRADLTFADTWSYDVIAKAWTLVEASNEKANRSTEAVVVREKKHRNSAYAFAGSSSTMPSFTNLPDGLKQDVVRFVPPSGWKKVALAGHSAVPRSRAHHGVVHAHARRSLFTYGGYTKDPQGGTYNERNFLGDLWEFSLASHAWTEHVPASCATPGKRDNAKLFYDEAHERVWLIGGANEQGTFNDLWFFSLRSSTWTRVDTLMAAPAPASRLGYQFFEEVNDDGDILFTIFGGSSSEFGSLFNDMWRLTIPSDF